MWGKALLARRGGRVSVPWESLNINPTRGQLITVMGSPGVGKSLLALNWCLTVPEFSILVTLDTDMPTQAMRACSILSGAPVGHVEERPDVWAQYLERKNLRCRMYDLDLDARGINDLVLAETEYWGAAPALVFVDNVSNVVTDTTYEAYRSCFIGLQKVARLQKCVVIALHHVKRDSQSGPLSLHSGQWAGEQESEIVLGLWRSSGSPQGVHNSTEATLNVAVLKNRNGQADPTGALWTPLTINHRNLQVTEKKEPAWMTA